MKTLLIFAYECKPFNDKGATIGAQRPYQIGNYLPYFGWKVIIICRNRKKERSISKIDKIKVKKLLKKEIVQINKNFFILPTPSLKHSTIIDKFWIFLSAHNLKNKLVVKHIKKILTVFKYFTGDYSESWQPIAKLAAEEISKKSNITCVIGEHSPDAGIYLAKWYSNKFNVPWIADFRDPILRPYSGISKSIMKYRVRKLLSDSEKIINVTPLWVKYDEKDFLKKGICITNGFDEKEFIDVKKFPNKKKFIVFYGGQIASFQNIETFFKAIQHAKRVKEKLFEKNFEFKYYGQGHIKINNLSKKYNIEKLVTSKSAIPRNMLLSIMKNSDILLLLAVDTSKNINKYFKLGCYPGKVFEYFGAEKPILCIPGDFLLEKLLYETNTGIVLKSVKEISLYLIKCLEEYENGVKLNYNPNKEIVNKFTRYSLAKKLSISLNKII